MIKLEYMFIGGILILTSGLLTLFFTVGYIYINLIANDNRIVKTLKRQCEEINVQKLEAMVDNAIITSNFEYDVRQTLDQEKDSAVMFYKSSIQKLLDEKPKILYTTKHIYISQLKEALAKYKIKFLKVKFLINEVNLEKEIIDSIFYQFRMLYSIVKRDFNNKLVSYSYNSGYFASDISTIENWFSKAEEQAQYLNLENIQPFISEISYKFEKMISDINVINISESLIMRGLALNDKAESVIKANKSLYKSNAKNINQKIQEIKKITITIENEASRRNTINLYSLNNNLKNILIDYSNLIDLELSSYLILKDNMTSLNMLFQNIYREKEVLVNEIIRTNIPDSNKKIDDISAYSNQIYIKMVELDNAKQKGFNEMSPSRFVEKYMEIMNTLKSYIGICFNIISEIKEILDLANKTNNSIFEINLKLLNIEQKRSRLPEAVQYMFEDKLNKVQILFNQFISLQKKQSSSVEISKEDSLISLKLMEKVNDYNKLINELYLSDKVVKQSIVELNKYIDKKPGIEFKIDELNKIYEKNQYNKALKAIVSICKEYRIYEH